MKITLRAAEGKDTQSLLGIYSYYVKNTAITFEYDVPSVEEFESRINHTLQKYPYIIAESDGEAVGYAYAGVFKDREAYERSVETSIYVKKGLSGNGIGKKLYSALEELLKMQNICNLYACIGYPEKEDEYLTKNSVYFHEKLGYRMVGEFYKCGYKFNRWYNMVWMEKFIGEHIGNQPPVKFFGSMKTKAEKKLAEISAE